MKIPRGWHPSKGLTPLEEFQYINELKRTKSPLYDYAITLEKGSNDLAWLKYQGLGNKSYKQWKDTAGLKSALQDAKTNTGGPVQHHTGVGAKVILGESGKVVATPAEVESYRNGDLELYHDPQKGESRLVTQEEYDRLSTDEPEVRTGNRGGLQGRFDEPLGVTARPNLFTPEEVSQLPRRGGAKDEYYAGPNASGKTPKALAYYGAQSDHNRFIKRVADQLDEKGYFTNKDGTPKMSGHKSPISNQEMTARQYFESSRIFNYGHRGAASNAGFGSISSWLGNAGPEFEYFNKLEGAILTPEEAIIINDINELQGETGDMLWDSKNKARFHAMNAELDKLIEEYGLEIPDKVSAARTEAKNYIDALDEWESPVDNQRTKVHGLLSDPALSGIDAASQAGKYSLLGSQNQLALQGKNVESAEVIRRLQLLNQVDGFQMDAWLQNRGADQIRKLLGEEEANRVFAALSSVDEQKTWLQSVRRALDDLRDNPNATIQNITDRAIKYGGRGVWGMAPIGLGLIDPKLAERWDNLGVHQGEDLISEATSILDEYMGTDIASGAQQTEDVALGVMTDLQNSDSWLDKARGHVGEFIYNTAKAGVTEVPGFIQSLFQGKGDVTNIHEGVDAFTQDVLMPRFFQGSGGDPALQDAVPMPQVEPVSNTVPMPQVEQLEEVVPMPSVNQLPQNVMELYPEATPWKKYGGLLQRQW